MAYKINNDLASSKLSKFYLGSRLFGILVSPYEIHNPKNTQNSDSVSGFKDISEILL